MIKPILVLTTTIFFGVLAFGLEQYMDRKVIEMERCLVLGHSAEGLRHLRLVMLEELATSEGNDDWLRAQIEWVDREEATTTKMARCG